MAKIKIHEIAKEMSLTSKEIIEKANELGISVKSHLSSIEEEQAKMIKDKLKNEQSKNSDVNNKNKKEVKKETKKENDKKKENAPVIIRREVIVSEENNEEKEIKKQSEKNNIGFVERNKNKNYNIVYRNKQQKPLTVSELFGIKDKKKEEEEK
ncbi:MAG: translation initiation factor IF-2 N-terminal domain-containing protein, partial [Clostridia bacterium]|nr:translation initiation factor IF-2 N-terminal domain-containing protein [Clostridia bacterium]